MKGTSASEHQIPHRVNSWRTNGTQLQLYWWTTWSGSNVGYVFRLPLCKSDWISIRRFGRFRPSPRCALRCALFDTEEPDSSSIVFQLKPCRGIISTYLPLFQASWLCYYYRWSLRRAFPIYFVWIHSPLLLRLTDGKYFVEDAVFPHLFSERFFTFLTMIFVLGSGTVWTHWQIPAASQPRKQHDIFTGVIILNLLQYSFSQ